ncbi:SDR family oxidoreductase [Herbiconiux moechotypicola]|uniref:SDR family oxidoreductase n=1 Tax=Herbiconiux moechotypicola TaxID=637393 RepID=A0ABN3E210_9MICO|nr:SDR family oxidoreductase [Herbiconiux moechotypicola]MCS5731358.1 SDR family oxidoreductase [Herbiconiux moechotypicola]
MSSGTTQDSCGESDSHRIHGRGATGSTPLAFDLDPAGVRVNAVAPGITMTDELARRDPYRTWAERSSDKQALKGHSAPDDVAAAAAFLASDDARFITGLILPVDGGLTAASGLPAFS